MTTSASKASSLFQFCLRLYKPHRKSFLFNACNVLLRGGLFLIPSYMTKFVLEKIVPSGNWSLLGAVCFAIVACPILGSLMILLETRLFRALDYSYGGLRADLFNGLQYRPFESWSRWRSGDLLTRILDESRTVADFTNGSILWALLLVASIVVGFVLLLTMHVGLGLMALGLWCGHSLLMVRISGQLRERSAETSRQTGVTQEAVRELLTGASFIKSVGMEQAAMEKALHALRLEQQVSRKNAITDQLLQGMNAILQVAFLAILYGVGGLLVARGTVTMGSLVAFIAIYTWIRPFGVSLFDVVRKARSVSPKVDRLEEIRFSSPPSSGIIPNTEKLDLVAERVRFAYDTKPVLNEVSFTIPQGSVVSVFGRRGAGKSTLVELLLGLRQPVSGSISIGGVPLSQVDETWLRSRLLCITQEVHIRAGTILDNIRYGRDEPSTEELALALQASGLDAWVAKLPGGLHTRVGDRGLILSGGERQRISIARAILRKPAILILDEATSALDYRTERYLLDRILQVLTGSTLIFITHRPAIAERSDQLYRVRNGELLMQDRAVSV